MWLNIFKFYITWLNDIYICRLVRIILTLWCFSRYAGFHMSYEEWSSIGLLARSLIIYTETKKKDGLLI